MIIDIDKKAEGEWFTFFGSHFENGKIVYDDPKPDAGRVRIRSMAPLLEERQANRKKKYEHVFNPETRAMERLGYYEDLTHEEAKKERDDLMDYVITGLENFYDKANKEITCTRENKLKLMEIPVFDRFVARCLQILAEAGVKAGEAEEKN